MNPCINENEPLIKSVLQLTAPSIRNSLYSSSICFQGMVAVAVTDQGTIETTSLNIPNRPLICIPFSHLPMLANEHKRHSQICQNVLVTRKYRTNIGR